jgi:hypothetical protein
LALTSVEVVVGAEEVHVVEVLIAVCGRLIGVLADAVSGVGYGRISQCRHRVGVAELGGAAVTPGFAFFVGVDGIGDIWATWRFVVLCCAASLRFWWLRMMRWAATAGMRGARYAVGPWGWGVAVDFV